MTQSEGACLATKFPMIVNSITRPSSCYFQNLHLVVLVIETLAFLFHHLCLFIFLFYFYGQKNNSSIKVKNRLHHSSKHPIQNLGREDLLQTNYIVHILFECPICNHYLTPNDKSMQHPSTRLTQTYPRAQMPSRSKLIR